MTWSEKVVYILVTKSPILLKRDIVLFLHDTYSKVTSFQAFSRSNDSEKIIECVTRQAYTLYPLFLIRIKQGSTIEGKIIWLFTFFLKSLADLADLAVTKFYWVTAVTEARMAKTKISVYRYTALTV